MSRSGIIKIDEGSVAESQEIPKELEERMRIFANLIIDRILADKELNRTATHCSESESKIMLKSN